MENLNFDKSRLVGDAYFANVIRIMGKARYELISRVAIDTNDHAFHVPVIYARVTNLFFRLRAKKLIVQMTYYENFYPDGRLQAYWEINFYAVFLPIATLVEMLYAKLGEKYFDGDCLSNIPLYSKCLDMPGRSLGGYSCDQERHRGYELSDLEAVDSAIVVRNILRALLEVEQYVCPGKFRELQVTSFPPHYVFPESMGTFWQRFNREALAQVVIRPWGSEFGGVAA